MFSDFQLEVVGLEDAAVAQAARLARGRELHQARGVGSGAVEFDGDGDALFTHDAVAVGGGHIPHAPGDGLADRCPLAIDHLPHHAFALGNAAEFGEGEGFHERCLKIER